MSFPAVTFAECIRWSSHPRLQKQKNRHISLLSESDLRKSLQQVYLCRSFFDGYKNMFIVVDKWGVNSHLGWQLFWLLAALAK